MRELCFAGLATRLNRRRQRRKKNHEKRIFGNKNKITTNGLDAGPDARNARACVAPLSPPPRNRNSSAERIRWSLRSLVCWLFFSSFFLSPVILSDDRIHRLQPTLPPPRPPPLHILADRFTGRRFSKPGKNPVKLYGPPSRSDDIECRNGFLPSSTRSNDFSVGTRSRAEAFPKRRKTR